MAIAFPAALQTYSLDWFPGANNTNSGLRWLGGQLAELRLVGASGIQADRDGFALSIGVIVTDLRTFRAGACRLTSACSCRGRALSAAAAALYTAARSRGGCRERPRS